MQRQLIYTNKETVKETLRQDIAGYVIHIIYREGKRDVSEGYVSSEKFLNSITEFISYYPADDICEGRWKVYTTIMHNIVMYGRVFKHWNTFYPSDKKDKISVIVSR